MRSIAASIVLIVLTAALAACSTSAGGALTGKAWQWTASTTKLPASQSVVPDPQSYTTEFKSDNTYAGKPNCNQIAGGYQTSGANGLTITPGPSTLAFCGEQSLDTIYVQGLAKAKSDAVANGQLTITLTDDGTMTFK